MWRDVRSTDRRGRPFAACRSLNRVRSRRRRNSASCLFDILFARSIRHWAYFFLPTLRRIVSSLYFIPLPLYGSGGRNARISLATCPTPWGSGPLTVIAVGRSVVILTSGGIG